MQPRVPAWGNEVSKPLTVRFCEKPVRVEAGRQSPRLTGEFTGETHRVLECTLAKVFCDMIAKFIDFGQLHSVDLTCLQFNLTNTY